MRQVLHGCATITHAIRSPIERSTASKAELSRTYGLNPETVAKWRGRDGVHDAALGAEGVPIDSPKPGRRSLGSGLSTVHASAT